MHCNNQQRMHSHRSSQTNAMAMPRQLPLFVQDFDDVDEKLHNQLNFAKSDNRMAHSSYFHFHVKQQNQSKMEKTILNKDSMLNNRVLLNVVNDEVEEDGDELNDDDDDDVHRDHC